MHASCWYLSTDMEENEKREQEMSEINFSHHKVKSNIKNQGILEKIN